MAPAGNETPNRDIFSWTKLSSVLDTKLKDVARKSDIEVLQVEVDRLRSENETLKQEVLSLSSRLEFVDQRSRRTNVMVGGIKSSSVQEAKLEFIELCSKALTTQVEVIEIRKLPAKNSYVVTLSNAAQAASVLTNKKRLKGTSIYIQKDYTKIEQSTRYHLRQIRKVIVTADKKAKVKFGEFCIYVNDCKFTWSDNHLVSTDVKDAEMLNSILENTNANIAIVVRPGARTENEAGTSNQITGSSTNQANMRATAGLMHAPQAVASTSAAIATDVSL